MQYKNILAMIFNEIKCHVNTSLGLVGGCIPCIPPVSAPESRMNSLCAAGMFSQRYALQYDKHVDPGFYVVVPLVSTIQQYLQ